MWAPDLPTIFRFALGHDDGRCSAACLWGWDLALRCISGLGNLALLALQTGSRALDFADLGVCFACWPFQCWDILCFCLAFILTFSLLPVIVVFLFLRIVLLVDGANVIMFNKDWSRVATPGARYSSSSKSALKAISPIQAMKPAKVFWLPSSKNTPACWPAVATMSMSSGIRMETTSPCKEKLAEQRYNRKQQKYHATGIWQTTFHWKGL